MDSRPVARKAYNILLAKLHAQGLLQRMFSIYSTLRSVEPSGETPSSTSQTPAKITAGMLNIATAKTAKLFIRKSGLEALESGIKILEQLGVPPDHGPLAAATTTVNNGMAAFKLSAKKREEQNEILVNRMDRLKIDAKWLDMQKKVSKLPIRSAEADLLDMIRKNPICIVKSATGSGKTTQVPQIILEQAIRAGRGASCNIMVTQPRLGAAKEVAKRVKAERFDGVGQDANTVGYHVRFDVSSTLKHF